MNNNEDEILKAVQEQKIKNDEHEQSVSAKGTILAAGITLIVTGIIVVIEFTLTHKWDFGKPAIAALMCSISYLFSGIKLKTTKDMILGIFSVFLFIICFILYIKGLL